jgi:hypothetical protein
MWDGESVAARHDQGYAVTELLGICGEFGVVTAGSSAW